MQAPPPAIVAPEYVRSGGKGRRAEEVELARARHAWLIKRRGGCWAGAMTEGAAEE